MAFLVSGILLESLFLVHDIHRAQGWIEQKKIDFLNVEGKNHDDNDFKNILRPTLSPNPHAIGSVARHE